MGERSADQWTHIWPVSDEAWADVDHDQLYELARQQTPADFVVIRQYVEHEPARIEEYGEVPERWVIVTRAVRAEVRQP